MVGRIIDFSARNRVAVLLFVSLVVAWGIHAIKRIPLDALPDLSDTQVIVYTEWTGRSPNLVEDQITYPVSSTLLAMPKVKAVRGYSFLGSSFIYVIFKDGTDIYWARSRVLEYLQAIRGKIPAGVNPLLGPDASSVGWGFSYALVDRRGEHDLSELRSLQDYNVKLALESVPGIAQVASIGGFVKQYQVNVDPNRLLAYGIPITRVFDAISRSNGDIEGRVIELSGAEYIVRGMGYIHDARDLEVIPLGTDGRGAPLYLRDVTRVQVGPEIRRGLADLDGKGEVVGGIVVVRFGENVLDVIERVKERIRKDIAPSLPQGVEIVTTYDRSDLILSSIATLRDEIVKLVFAVSLVCIVFLFHMPSALVILLTLPGAIIASFLFLYHLGISSNIMSLSGIAITIGVMVDASIIMVENAHKKLEDWEARGRPGSRTDVLAGAAREVGPSLFFALLVITVAFLPVFALEAQGGRLFRPLAFAKTFAMLSASFLAVTFTPALMTLLIRGRARPEQGNPLNRLLQRIYDPVVRFSLRRPGRVFMLAGLLMAATVYPIVKLGSEFMPPLFEGSLFYMPVTVPGVSISEISSLLRMQDSILASIPEVSQVFGKAGRAETATDPAPLEMFETVINLKPESQWRPGMTVQKLVEEMNGKLQIPGVANSFTMPIKARIDMLSTGIRTPLGIKILGPELGVIEKIGTDLEKAIRQVPGTVTVYAEKVTTGYYLDIAVKRDEAARYNLSVDDVNAAIQASIGGVNLTTTVEGRARYPVNVRYERDLRGEVDSIGRVLVPVVLSGPASFGSGPGDGAIAQVPLYELADIRVSEGPSLIKSEQGMLSAYVYIHATGKDTGSYIKEAEKKIAGIKIPSGYRLEWGGDYQYMAKTREQLKTVIPFTLLIILFILYLNTRSLTKTAIVLLAVPFSLIGSFWLLYLLNYNMSTAVWVGIIALAGLDAETGVIMLLYLDLAYRQRLEQGGMRTEQDLREAVMHGAVKRLRPKVMTVTTILAGLIPIMFSSGMGSEVMKRISAPMIGGVVTSTILELAVYPAVFMLWARKQMRKEEGTMGAGESGISPA
ncbi:MAG TPA: CusA/CzcA family heavy metal efflux RND transporter [Deltaproteobacteria bacterium]|jgi:Cu(I)/Ag(I) efflux system membrane protein CusA/SilA|nr:CusA/CzcA family heavy metal efflux RND transporter [Deltaproteobacteria bacterium]